MRGNAVQQAAMFSYVSPEQRVPSDHPLRPIREIADKILGQLSRAFARMYSQIGRPSIPPEQLLRALLLQVLYTVRSERMLMEQLEYNLLVSMVRWAEHGRYGLGCDRVHEKSRAAIESRCGQAVLLFGCSRSQSIGSDVGRALHRGRDPVGSLCEF